MLNEQSVAGPASRSAPVGAARGGQQWGRQGASTPAAQPSQPPSSREGRAAASGRRAAQQRPQQRRQQPPPPPEPRYDEQDQDEGQEAPLAEQWQWEDVAEEGWQEQGADGGGEGGGPPIDEESSFSHFDVHADDEATQRAPTPRLAGGRPAFNAPARRQQWGSGGGEASRRAAPPLLQAQAVPKGRRAPEPEPIVDFLEEALRTAKGRLSERRDAERAAVDAADRAAGKRAAERAADTRAGDKRAAERQLAADKAAERASVAALYAAMGSDESRFTPQGAGAGSRPRDHSSASTRAGPSYPRGKAAEELVRGNASSSPQYGQGVPRSDGRSRSNPPVAADAAASASRFLPPPTPAREARARPPPPASKPHPQFAASSAQERDSLAEEESKWLAGLGLELSMEGTKDAAAGLKLHVPPASVDRQKPAPWEDSKLSDTLRELDERIAAVKTARVAAAAAAAAEEAIARQERQDRKEREDAAARLERAARATATAAAAAAARADGSGRGGDSRPLSGRGASTRGGGPPAQRAPPGRSPERGRSSGLPPLPPMGRASSAERASDRPTERRAAGSAPQGYGADGGGSSSSSAQDTDARRGRPDRTPASASSTSVFSGAETPGLQAQVQAQVQAQPQAQAQQRDARSWEPPRAAASAWDRPQESYSPRAASASNSGPFGELLLISHESSEGTRALDDPSAADPPPQQDGDEYGREEREPSAAPAGAEDDGTDASASGVERTDSREPRRRGSSPGNASGPPADRPSPATRSGSGSGMRRRASGNELVLYGQGADNGTSPPPHLPSFRPDGLARHRLDRPREPCDMAHSARQSHSILDSSPSLRCRRSLFPRRSRRRRRPRPLPRPPPRGLLSGPRGGQRGR